ncbi:MAG: 3-dehydroquinate synthase [Gammaproteobacteria bacterium]|jgi:3-dehydroquinate synthase|nr:3-dehydroquinate synthase [Gammaproteobacteria bacterium]
MVDSVQVQGEGFAYPVHIAAGLLDDIELWQQASLRDGVLIVSNDVVADLYLARLQQTLQRAGISVSSCILPDGEQHKSIASWQQILDQLLTMHANRRSSVIALGGGVIGDLAGFAAACYMRGINVIQVPTTLLAQVDASVGGKTGANVAQGKNLIGAFHQPGMVVIDTDTLATLPQREYLAGVAEVIKYAMIMDADLCVWLEQHAAAVLRRETAAIEHMIRTSVAHKAAVVAADTREQGRRAVLNYGHSFAHALESQTGYTHWLHGEAVAIGMHLAANFGRSIGCTDQHCVERQLALLKRFGFDLSMPQQLQPQQLAEAMLMDKKADHAGITLVLLRSIGEAVIKPGFELSQLREFLQHSMAA